MVHPLLTVLLDAVLIGSAVAAIAMIAAEEVARRRAVIPPAPSLAVVAPRQARRRQPRLTVGARPPHLRRRALSRVA